MYICGMGVHVCVWCVSVFDCEYVGLCCMCLTVSLCIYGCEYVWLCVCLFQSVCLSLCVYMCLCESVCEFM